MANSSPVGVAFRDPDLTAGWAIDGIVVSATAAQLNTAATITAATPGVAAASTAVVLDANKRVATLGAFTWGEPNAYALVTGITAGTTQTQAGATLLTGEINNVTVVANPLDGVRLPSAAAGNAITIKNNGANILRVWPFSGDSINAMAVNLSVDLPVNGTLTFYAVTTVVWETQEVVTLQAPSTQKGSTVIDAQDNAGNTVTRITTASQAAARTYTIPDQGQTAANFVMSAVDGITSMTTSATPASGSNTVQFVFKNGAGNAITGIRRMTAWISDINGAPVTAVTSFAAATNGNVDLMIVGKIYAVQCTAAGLLGLLVTGSAATRYVSFQLTDGTILTSSAIVIN